MRRLTTFLAFAGGLIGLANYVWDGWTVVSGGRDLYVLSNSVSIVLLTISGSAAVAILLRSRNRMPEEERKEYRATLAISALALVVLISWMLFRALSKS